MITSDLTEAVTLRHVIHLQDARRCSAAAAAAADTGASDVVEKSHQQLCDDSTIW